MNQQQATNQTSSPGCIAVAGTPLYVFPGCNPPASWDSWDFNTDSASWDPSAWKAVARGYCFHCDQPVDIEYHQMWAGAEPPRRCLRCGVEFLGRVAMRLLERIEELERQLRLIKQQRGGALP